MRRTRQLIALLLVVTLVVSAFPTLASADEPTDRVLPISDGIEINYTATSDGNGQKIGQVDKSGTQYDLYLASLPNGATLTGTNASVLYMFGGTAIDTSTPATWMVCYAPSYGAAYAALLSPEEYLEDSDFATAPSGSQYEKALTSRTITYSDGYTLPANNVTGCFCEVYQGNTIAFYLFIQISTATGSEEPTPTDRVLPISDGIEINYTATSDGNGQKIGQVDKSGTQYDLYLASLPNGATLTGTNASVLYMFGGTAIDTSTPATWMVCYAPSYGAAYAALLSPEEYLEDSDFATAPSGSQYEKALTSRTVTYNNGYTLPVSDVSGCFCEVYQGNTIAFYLFIQISTATGSNTGAVDKSSLEAEIAKVMGDNAANYYQSADRYNGKETSTNGFWADLTVNGGPLAKAQAVYDNTSATQAQVDAATETLSAAIARLIPTSQLNATELYEKIELVNSIFPPANSAQYTASSWAEYRAGMDTAEAYLASLFYDNGEATELNVAANQSIADGYAADVWALALNNVLDKKLSTLGVSANDRLNDAKQAYTALKNLCNVFFNPRDYAGADYTEDSWAAYASAYETAQAFLSSHDGTTLTLESGVNEAQSYKDAYQAFWDACYGLTENSATITVTLDVSDTFARINGMDHLAGGSYYLSLSKGASLEDAAQAAGIDLNALSDWSAYASVKLGVYVNGVYTQYTIGQESFPGAKTKGITLNGGDRILIARMDAPMAQSSAGGSSGAAGLSEVGSYIRYAAFRQGGTELDRLEATANTDFTLEAATIDAEAYNALPTHYNGRVAPLAGAEIYRSKAYATEAEARAAAADIATGVITKSDGTFSLKLYSAEDSDSGEGWYLLNILASGENPGLTNAPNLLVHITDPDDLSDVRAQLRAQLDEIYNAYSNDFYTESQLAEVQAYYDAGCAALADETASSGDLYAAYETAYEGIRAIQEQCEASLNAYLADIEKCLALLPTQADLNEGRVYQADMILLEALFGDEGIYSARMSDYQKNQLSQSDLNLIQGFQSIYSEVKAGTRVLEALPENRIAVQFLDAATGDTVDEAYFYLFNISLEKLKDTLNWDGELLGVGYSSSGSTTYLEDSNPWPGSHAVASENLYKSFFLGVIMAPGYVLDHIEAPLDEHYMVTDGTWEGEAWYYFEPQSGIQGAMGNLGGAFITPRGDIEIKIFLKADSPLEIARQNALAELKAAYDSYKRSDYSETNWNTLSEAYQAGVDAINAAEDEDAIQTAFDTAFENMSKVEKDAAPGSEGIPGWGPDDPFNAGAQVGTVSISVRNDKFPEGAFTGIILSFDDYPIGERDNMMTVILRALHEAGYSWNGTGGSASDAYDIGYLAYIYRDTNGNGKYDENEDEPKLGEFSGENTSGWMGTLNDFMVNEGLNMFTVASGKLGDGDEIALQFTQNLGVDLGGSWGNSDTTLASLEVSTGTLIPEFESGESGQTYDFALMISGSSAGVVVTPKANNINFMVKTFLNEKVTTDAVGNSYYRRSETITVRPGDVIYVGCGERAWPSMNKQGSEASGYSGTWYALHVINADNGADFVNELIAKLPSQNQINLNNYEDVQEQIAEIDEIIAALSSAEQSKVNDEALEAARDRTDFFAEIAEVKAMLAALPKSSSLDDAGVLAARSAIEAASRAYEKLTDEQKGYITVGDVANYNELVERLKALTPDTPAEPITGSTTTPENKMPFVDVAEDAFYYDAVLWAVNSDPQITNGTSETTFEPNADCLREQIVTFLWRAAGKPAPSITESPFEDVAEGAYYYEAVIWAYENGITLGVDATHFGVGQPCTREQVVTFLWRAANKPATSVDESFTDVADGEYYAEAVNWAAEEEITLGIGDGKFGTGLTCTRGQIVTFLYRAREE